MRDYMFGNYLRELRELSGLSQYALGRLVGVSDKAVSKWECGVSKPQSRTLAKLCRTLGVAETVRALTLMWYRLNRPSSFDDAAAL